MNRYPEYKQSGIEWIGEIPSHWEVKRGKFVTRLLSGYPFDSKKFTYDDTFMPLIRIRDINNETTEVFFSGEYPSDFIVSKGDVLIGMDGDFNVARWNGENALLNQRVCMLLRGFPLSERFGFYLLLLPLKLINDVTYATTVKHLSIYDIYQAFFPIPSNAEQEAIADWLDAKCEKIDAIINKQKQRIALLDEMRQTIITQAVTRGLNPDMPLKESGIAWVRQIPSHWERWRLKFTGSFGNGLTYSPNDVVDEGICVLRSSNIQDGKLDFEDSVYVSDCPGKLMTDIGDIIICSRNGSANLVGKCALVSKKINATFGAFMMRYRPHINSEFAYYLFNTTYRQYRGLFATTTINQLTKTVVDTMDVPLPPMGEQIAIASYLDTECDKIDKQIAHINQEIELLEEYKQSVITEVVTGKRRVCDIAVTQ